MHCGVTYALNVDVALLNIGKKSLSLAIVHLTALRCIYMYIVLFFC